MMIDAHRRPNPIEEPGDDTADTPPDLPQEQPPVENEPEPGGMPEHDPLQPEEPARDAQKACIAL